MFILLPKIHSLAFSVEVPCFLQSHQSHKYHQAVSRLSPPEVIKTRIFAWLNVIIDTPAPNFTQYFVGTEMNYVHC